MECFEWNAQKKYPFTSYEDFSQYNENILKLNLTEIQSTRIGLTGWLVSQVRRESWTSPTTRRPPLTTGFHYFPNILNGFSYQLFIICGICRLKFSHQTIFAIFCLIQFWWKTKKTVLWVEFRYCVQITMNGRFQFVSVFTDLSFSAGFSHWLALPLIAYQVSVAWKFFSQRSNSSLKYSCT